VAHKHVIKGQTEHRHRRIGRDGIINLDDGITL
jgi:hypothetical protein